jgi:ketosteroid isomerase-like protein
MGIFIVMVLHALLSAQAGPDDIRAVLQKQEQDWNRGDVNAFMDGYVKTADLVFTSGGEIYRGWTDALARYRTNYPDRAAMGQLHFSDIEITMLSPESAVVLGKWALERANDKPHGVFTVVFRRQPEGWRIVHDHTSSSKR